MSGIPANPVTKALAEELGHVGAALTLMHCLKVAEDGSLNHGVYLTDFPEGEDLKAFQLIPESVPAKSAVHDVIAGLLLELDPATGPGQMALDKIRAPGAQKLGIIALVLLASATAMKAQAHDPANFKKPDGVNVIFYSRGGRFACAIDGQGNLQRVHEIAVKLDNDTIKLLDVLGPLESLSARIGS